MTNMFFPGGHVLLQIVLRTSVIYLLVLIGVRISGKREVGQMTPFDLTLLRSAVELRPERDDWSGYLAAGRRWQQPVRC